MPSDTRQIEELVLTRIMRLNAMIHGLVAGILLGLAVFIATLWLIMKGGSVIGPHLALLGQFFIGYKVTLLGSVIGFAYGFVLGFLIGYFIAATYNRLADRREPKRQTVA